MKSINRLEVKLDFGIHQHGVGELALSGKDIYFRYYPDFLTKNLDISPFKLKRSSNVLNAGPQPFEGLFGVFSDSLPDGWGRLLLDRKLSAAGTNPASITPLDRLAFVGTGGAGALTYHPVIENDETNPQLDLDIYQQESTNILEGKDSEVIDLLFRHGGSSGGARPKVYTGYNADTNKIKMGMTEIRDSYEPWIIKFASSSDYKDIANIEFAYYQMAIDCGIEMSPCRLFEGKSGNLYFGTKRFDRNEQQRLHMHTAAGMMHDNYRISQLDYGHLLDCAFKLEKHVQAYQKVFQLAAFNVFVHNRDDHSKNFAFLMDADGKWQMAPAYDLTFSHSTFGHHSTMVSGESQQPGTKHLMALAAHFDIADAQKIIDQVKSVAANWKHYAATSGVLKTSSGTIDRVLQKQVLL